MPTALILDQEREILLELENMESSQVNVIFFFFCQED